MSVTPIALHRASAVGAFRWTVFFFVAIAAFAQRDEKTGTILATLVFLIDVVSWNLGELIAATTVASSNQQWHSTLTDRLIFEKTARSLPRSSAYRFRADHSGGHAGCDRGRQ
jgi:hypothetical protein